MSIEEDLEKLYSRVEELEREKRFMTNNGYITIEDVVRAICKKLNIDIVEIDTTPTIPN